MSGALLLIAALWLILLAPLLLRNQKPVRRTAQALSETRVLHRGGSALNRRRKLKPAESLYQADDSEEDLELVDAEPEYILFDDSLSEDEAKAKRKTAAMKDGGVFTVAADPEAELVDAEAEAADEAPEADVDADTAEQEILEGEIVDADADTDTQDEQDTATTEVAEDAEGTGADETNADATDVDAEADETLDADEPQSRAREIDAAYFRGGDLSARVRIEDEVEEPSTSERNLEQLLGEPEVSDEDMAYVESRAGRGVYNPVLSQRLAEQRLKRRKQVLAVLALLCILSLGAGLILGGRAWLAVVAAVGFTLFYLYALRRQVIAEQKLRARRLARMRRARLGVRNTEDEALGVPSRLMRPGAVIVETDDADPEFAHLDYLDSSEIFDDGPQEEYQDLRAV